MFHINIIFIVLIVLQQLLFGILLSFKYFLHFNE